MKRIFRWLESRASVDNGTVLLIFSSGFMAAILLDRALRWCGR